MTFIEPYQSKHRLSCLTIFDSNTPPFFDPIERAYFEAFLTAKDENRIAYPNAEIEPFYVLIKDNSVLACGGFYVVKGESKTKLSWGMVERKFHQMGYGKMLIQYRFERMRELYPTFGIHVDTSQHTFGFFEKQGFKISKITKDGYAPGLDKYDLEIEE